jgi:orotate phosphoribosyltransferase
MTTVQYLRQYAYRRAPEGQPFTLASGATSIHYIDVRSVALRGLGAIVIADAILDLLRPGTFGPVAAVAGVALGGCPLATAVSVLASLRGSRLDAVYVRKEAKAHGTGKLIEAPPDVTRVVLLEDVVTTGGSSITAAEHLEAAGYTVGGIIAVVDRRPEPGDTLGRWPFASVATFAEITGEAR